MEALARCEAAVLFSRASGCGLALMLALAGPLSAAATDKVRLQLKWQHQFQFAGYYAAQAQGFYRAAGLEVEFLPSNPGEDPVQRVLQGKAEFGVGTTDLLLRRDQGAPVVALAVIVQHSPLALMTLKKPGVQTVHDVAGGNVMLEPDAAEILAYLRSEGLSAGTFKQIPHTFDIQDLLSGKVDACAVYVTDEPFRVEKAGQEYLLYSPRAAGIDFYGDNLFTTEALLKQKPELVKKFRDASLKGWNYAMRHQEELTQLIYDRYSKRLSLENLRFEARQMEPLLQTALVEIGHMNPGRWHHIAETYAGLGMLKPDFELKGFLYDPHPSPPDLRWLYGLVGALALVLAGVSSLAVYIHRTNAQLRQDAADRKLAAEALRKSEEAYRMLFHAMMDGFALHEIILDEAGKPADYRFLAVNPAFERMTGLKAEDVVGKSVLTVLPGTERHWIEAYGRVALTGEPVFFNDYSNELKRHFEVTAFRPGPLQFACVFADVTERKRAETELQKLQKLQSVGTLAGGIAHDFNNILMGLFGNISLAKEELPPSHPVCAALEEAEKSMNRAVRLTKQLLTFAKGGEPVKENVGLGTLIEEVAKFDLVGSQVKLVFQQEERLWLAEADKGQIQQVVSNLVINARQAMPEGGRLYVTLENAELSKGAVVGLRQGKYVKVSVRDEGSGIDPKFIDRIFDPYFSTKQTGSGLGLATVYSIINKHGGHIGVVSDLGKGTSFTFYLPASEVLLREGANPPVADVPSPASPARILVMDDEEMVCALVVKMLTKSGFSAATAPNGQEAVAMYKQALEAGTPFDAVILDLTVPGGIGGKDALQALLAVDPGVRAIVSSGYADDPVMANYAEYGFKGIAAKPYTLSELRSILAKVLG
jgi:PAS domain S-box-containing protein